MNEFLIKEFINLGCKSPREASIALQVYIELSEVKRLYEVEYQYNNEIETLYFMAKQNKKDDKSIFVPFPSCDGLSFHDMQKYFKLSPDNDLIKIYLVFVSGDSTCVFYQINNGLSEPSVASSKNLRQNQQEKLDSELRRNKDLLEQAALIGSPVTIPRKDKGKKRPLETEEDS